MVRLAKLSGRTLWRIFWELLLLLVVCAIGGGLGLWLAPIIKADPSRVYVSPRVDGASVLATRISTRLTDADEIAVAIYADGEAMDLSAHQGQVLIAARTDGGLVVRGNGWVPQVVLDDKTARVSNVAHKAADRVFLLIREIHTWQGSNPKPKPPPAPRPPAEPIDWQPILTGTAIASVVGGSIGWLVYRFIRKRRIVAGLMARADAQQKLYDSGDLSWLEKEDQ